MNTMDVSALSFNVFDTVDHKIITSRLCTDFGITGKVLKWGISYLTNRSFSVNSRKVCSNPKKTNFGVPQGSLLGPILFILYTKEISNIAEKYGLHIRV